MDGNGKKDFPRRVAERASSCPKHGKCSEVQLNSSKPNPFNLRGALVYGQGTKEEYKDNDRKAHRALISLDNNAGVSGLFAAVDTQYRKPEMCEAFFGIVDSEYGIC